MVDRNGWNWLALLVLAIIVLGICFAIFLLGPLKAWYSGC
jgi:hypothetical protein